MLTNVLWINWPIITPKVKVKVAPTTSRSMKDNVRTFRE